MKMWTRKMEANEGGRGNLAGIEIRCSCGYLQTTTMVCSADLMLTAHASYHAKYDGKRK